MLHGRITTLDAFPAGPGNPLHAVQSLLDRLEDFAVARRKNIASQHRNPADASALLAARYAAANSITRRRFDAIFREAETVARTGTALLIGRADRQDAATIAAARFLGKTIAASLGKLDDLLASRAA